jgi:hypothetical protein
MVGQFDAEGRPLEDKPGKRRTEAGPKRTACGTVENHTVENHITRVLECW